MRSWLEPPASCTQLVPDTPSLAASALAFFSAASFSAFFLSSAAFLAVSTFGLEGGFRLRGFELGLGNGGSAKRRLRRGSRLGRPAPRRLRRLAAGIAGLRLAQELGDVIEAAARSGLRVGIGRFRLLRGRAIGLRPPGRGMARRVERRPYRGEIGRRLGRFLDRPARRIGDLHRRFRFLAPRARRRRGLARPRRIADRHDRRDRHRLGLGVALGRVLGEDAEVHRRRFLVGAQHRQHLEEGLEPQSRARHGGVDRPPRAFAVAGKRQDEGVDPHRFRVPPQRAAARWSRRRRGCRAKWRGSAPAGAAPHWLRRRARQCDSPTAPSPGRPSGRRRGRDRAAICIWVAPYCWARVK